MAKLQFRYGAMNSGKTMNLLQIAYNFLEKGKKIAIIKPFVDTKGEDKIVSRVGINRKVDYLLKKDESIIKKMATDLDEIDAILVDEVQFMSEKQIDELFFMSKKLNILVIAFGLRTNFKMEGFPASLKLLALADSLIENVTLCECGSKALFTARVLDSNYTLQGDDILIDGEKEVSYVPLCGKCFLEKVAKK